MRLIAIARSIVALGFIVLGIFCLMFQNFIVGRPPGWGDAVAHPIGAYGGGGIVLLAGIALLVNKKPVWSALVIAAVVFILSLVPHVFYYGGDWVNMLKTLALIGTALIVAASYNRNNIKNMLQAAGAAMLSIFFIGAGYAHFYYAEFVFNLVPSFIPFHEFFTYFCGVCLIAGGIGIWIPKVKACAALLSAIMVGSWFLLVHIPRALDNTKDLGEKLGVFESFIFAGGFLVLYVLLKKQRQTI